MSSKFVKPVSVARYVAAFAVASLPFGAVAAHADALMEAGSANAVVAKVVVDYSDLDLSQAADARSLYARLQRASQRACGDYKDVRNLRTKPLYTACYQNALARAVDDVGHASVQAVFAADERIRLASRSSKDQAGT